MKLRIGVLALQGDFARHAQAFEGLDQPVDEVRHVRQLEDLDGLIIPGGETTTLLNLMQDEPWFERLRGFHRRGGALFGTCAGAILLASKTGLNQYRIDRKGRIDRNLLQRMKSLQPSSAD